MPEVYPFLILIIGIAMVVGGIVALRLNAFLALIAAAMIVSLLSPGSWSEKISRVSESFGSTAAGIGIVIGYGNGPDTESESMIERFPGPRDRR